MNRKAVIAVTLAVILSFSTVALAQEVEVQTDYSIEGELEDFAIEPPSGKVAWRFINGNTYRNPKISMQYVTTHTSVPTEQFCGIIFGAQNEENFYALLTRFNLGPVETKPEYALIERSEGSFSFLTDWKPSPNGPDSSMTVVVKDDFVALLSGEGELGDTLLEVRTDLDARDGQIGAIAGGLGIGEETVFRLYTGKSRNLVAVKPTKDETVEEIRDYSEEEEAKEQHEAGF